MNAVKENVKVTYTPQRRQEKYADLLDDLLGDTSRRYENAKSEFGKDASQCGYDYAMRWRLETVVQLEHLVRFTAPVASMPKMLIDGQATQAQVEEGLEQHAQALTDELIGRRTWEHHCTCAYTNLAALEESTAKAQAVQMIQKLSYFLSRIGQTRNGPTGPSVRCGQPALTMGAQNETSM